MKYKVKFFGAHEIKHEPLRKVIEFVEADSEHEAIEKVNMKYERVNGLKISKVKE